MSVKNAIQSVVMASFWNGLLTPNYKVMNASGLEESCFLIRVINNTTDYIGISFDGVTDHDFLKRGAVLRIAALNFPLHSSNLARFSKYTKVYIKGPGAKLPPDDSYVHLCAYYRPIAN